MRFGPSRGLPGGQIVVPAAQNGIGPDPVQRGKYATIDQEIVPAKALPPRREHLVRKLDFIFVNPPLPQAGIVLSEKDHMEINFSSLRQRVENRDPVGGDDLGENYQLRDQAVGLPEGEPDICSALQCSAL
jgi:hypothetical protein